MEILNRSSTHFGGHLKFGGAPVSLSLVHNIKRLFELCNCILKNIVHKGHGFLANLLDLFRCQLANLAKSIDPHRMRHSIGK